MDTRQVKTGQQLMLSENAYNRVAEILADLSANTRADVIVFCESNGYPVIHHGNSKDLDLMAISSLAANNFSATAQMATMVGEKNSFKFLFHEGENTNIYLSNVGFNFILVVVFSVEVALGMIRVFTNKAIKEINRALKSVKEEEKSEEFVDLEFKTLLGEELNRSLKF
ncbi:MAG: roadblock/LC7 domain-containing protein [bacterium]